MDLADSNGLALGDDEAEEAMQQMQMLTSDVDMMPPLYRCRDDGELKLRTGRPARMLRPRDFCLMILDNGHWLGVTALYDEGHSVWEVNISGLARMDQQDVAEWRATIHQLTDIPLNHMRITEARTQPRGAGGVWVCCLGVYLKPMSAFLGLGPAQDDVLYGRPGFGRQDFEPFAKSEAMHEVA